MRPLRRSFSLFLVALIAACASGGAAGSSGSAARATITDAEFAAAGAETTFETVQRLRPEWLRPRATSGGSGSLSPAGGSGEVQRQEGSNMAPLPAIVIEGQRFGEAADLRSIPSVSVSLARFYNVDEAKRRFGMQYAGGVIELTYRKR